MMIFLKELNSFFMLQLSTILHWNFSATAILFLSLSPCPHTLFLSSEITFLKQNIEQVSFIIPLSLSPWLV